MRQDVEKSGGKAGRRKIPYFPKGRLLRPEERERLSELLPTQSLQRSLLIEYLHKIQDQERCLPAGLLHALADAMGIPMAEVYEVASFYAHFDIRHDGEPAPAEVTIRVCDSLTCMMHGAESFIEDLSALASDDVRIVRAPCMGRCDHAPVCEIGHRHLDNSDIRDVEATLKARAFTPQIPAYRSLDAYRADGGYRMLEALTTGEMLPEQVIDTLSNSGLRGLGGAGFPTGRKWQLVRTQPAPRLMAVNADEGEPGTFKDRHYLESNPHQFLEGMLIAAKIVEAERVYIYLRDEYPAIRQILTDEIALINAAGYAAHTELELRRGAGAYICGEESAMIESIEGKRGLPRHRPPYVAERGLFGRPTLVNNVETLYWVPKILREGATWFEAQGTDGAKGLRSYSVSGHVKHPGVKLVPAGISARRLIEEHCGGMAAGHRFVAYLPGGASGGILPESLADLPLDFGKLEKYGSFVGSHAVVILSDQDDLKQVVLNLMRFFEDESCGQCTPCRNGTEKAVQLMAEGVWDHAMLSDLCQVMADASICGLGQAAPNPLRAYMTFFSDPAPDDASDGASDTLSNPQ